MTQAAAIAKLLGGPKVLHRSVKSTYDLIDAIHEGLPVESVEVVSKRVGISAYGEASKVLHIPARTLARRQASGGRLAPIESERVVRLARIARRAEEVLEDVEKSRIWLREPNRALGRERPLDLLDTDLGMSLVEDVLDRIEHSVYA